MENILKIYFEKQYLEQELPKPNAPGPVITISREFGCPSKAIAQMLTDALNKRLVKTSVPKWKFINKEVVEEAARKLDIKTVEMNYLISLGEKGIIEDLLTSFSPNYVSSRKIKKILTDVLNAIASQGQAIFVGRGSVAILQKRPNVLHIRLNAPQEVRIHSICNSRNLKAAEAVKLVDEMDKKRTRLIEFLLGHKFDPCIFDLTFNCHSFSKEDIVESIIKIMEIRKMI
jgi:cytidylate kinase